MIHYIVRWWDKEKKKWIKSTIYGPATEEEARKQLDRDINYFYDDIEIQLVKVTEEVLESYYGLNPKRVKVK